MVPASLIASAGQSSVTISTDGAISSGAVFTTIPQPPTIASLSPAIAIAGGAAFTLTISGSNFTSSAVALWNGSALTTTYKSVTQLNVAIPSSLIASVGTASVTVSTTGGVSPAATFTVNPPAPAITSLSPASAIAGGDDFTLTINGTNFTTTATANWGATALPATYVSASQLTVSVSANLIASVGAASITVGNITGNSSGKSFAINPPPPVIASLSPAFTLAGGAAFTMTLSGTNFTSTSTALWNSTSLAVTYLSPTQLTVAIPASLIASASTPSITVSNVSGISPGVNFTVNPPAPVITSLSPAIVLAGGNDFTLAISGTNFTSTATVSFGATQLAAATVSATKLTATVPAALIASVGTATVTVTNVTGTSSGAIFTINQPLPTVANLNPASTVAGGADLLLTINGTNFDAAAIASWGSSALATTLLSSTQLTATLPAALTANPGAGSIFDGGVSSGLTFTIIPQPPTIASLSPAIAIAGGAAFTLTISGINFTSSAVVLWNGSALTTTYKSASQLTAVVPASLISAVNTSSITVSTTGGVSPAATFTVNPSAPVISSLSPASAIAGGNDLTLTLIGTNFTSTSTITFAGTQLAASYLSATQMTATIPAALTASAGTAAVTVSNVTGISSGKNFAINPPPPVIASLSPAFIVVGSAAFTMTISGTNFTSTSTVLWWLTPIAFTYVSPTQLTVAIPASLIASVGTGSFTVRNVSGTSPAVSFAVNPLAPTITSLSPASALAGGAAFTLTVNGANFTSTSTVNFGATQLAATTVNSAKLTATVPTSLIAIVGTAAVTVTNVSGTSPAATFTINQPPPTVANLNPASTVAGGADLLLTINGTNFDAASIASWGSTALATTLISSTQLTATLPAALTANPGAGSITVSTDGGISPSVTFTIIPQPPTISSLSPAIAIAGGAALTLTISGTNFISTAAAKWNTISLTTTYKSASQLTAVVPASLISAVNTSTITVSTTGGVSSGATFTINPPAPTITYLNPSIAVAGSAAYTLTINGTNFTATSTVLWGSTPLTAVYVSATQLTATVPASLISNIGTAGVKVSNVTGSSSSATVTINPQQPVITSLTPNSVLASNGAFTMTVNGTNFQPGAGGSTVRWNYTALTTTYVSPTQLTAAVPANFLSYGSASVYVITAGGTSPGFPFTVIPPPPVILVMSMTRVPAGFGAFTMNVYGNYFTAAMVLNWGTTPLSGTLVGGTTYTLAVPANLVATVGTVSLTVTTVGGTSSPVTFTITQPQPTITSISPASIGAGSATFKLTVNGSNFISGMNTKFGSAWVGANIISSTQLTVTIPAYMVATAGTVGVMTNTTGGISATLPFTINPASPVITSLSPNSATAGSSGFLVTINGTAFTTTTAALWGAIPLDTIYVSPTQVKASIPASLIGSSGTAGISVVSPVGSSNSATFLTSPAAPQISGLNPGAAAAGGAAFTLTINGAYFTASTTSKWGSTALATTYISSTQLTAVVPAKLIASAGTGRITVTTAVGTSPSATFTIYGPPSITTTTLPSATAGLAYSGSVNVTGGAPGYSWTVSGLPSNFTYFNTSGSTLTITGIPASTGKISFQVSAQDTLGSSAGPVTLSINVSAGPTAAKNSSLNGSYTCLMQGSIDDDGTRWASILNFQADGQGSFTNGIYDINSYDIGSASGIVSGSYTIGADNNGQASVRTILTNNAAGVQTTQWTIALSGSAQPAAQFRMVEDDDLGTLPSGQQGAANCYLATPGAFSSSTISGSSFAFALDGEDNDSNLKATAGQFSASNGVITSGALDTAMGGSTTDQSASFTGSYTAPDPATGRFTIDLSGAGSSTGYTVYIIDASRMFILDNTSNNGEQAGSMRAQKPAAVTTAALSGSFVLYNRGAQFNANSGIPTSFYANLLLGAGDGAGNITINQSYANNAGSYAAGTSDGGPTALAFDSANPGRASFQTASGATYLYFYDANSAFELSVGSNGSVDSGWLEAQSQATFTNAALTGNYLFGELPLLSVQPTAYAGEYNLSLSGALTAGLTTSTEGALSWDQALTTTYAWDTTATGVFLIASGAQGKASCAVISATRFACIPQADIAPSIQIMQQ
jgi:hypothetical protein